MGENRVKVGANDFISVIFTLFEKILFGRYRNEGSGISDVELNDLIDWLVKTDDPEEVKSLYRQWAETYDRDLDDFGYVAPEIGVALFRELIEPGSAIIHDAGCGTGQVGQLLRAAGYSHVDGSDFSEDMLKVAQSRDCYRTLSQADYTRPLGFESDSVDAIISIGVYSKRFRNVFLDEMLRILKPGGCMLLSCRPVYFEEVAASVRQLHVDQRITASAVRFDNYMTGQNASAYYISFEKTRPEKRGL